MQEKHVRVAPFPAAARGSLKFDKRLCRLRTCLQDPVAIPHFYCGAHSKIINHEDEQCAPVTSIMPGSLCSS